MALLPFKHPFTAVCCGSTGSGKTLFVLRLIDNVDTMIEPTPKCIIYYLMEYQSVFDEYPQVDFRQGVKLPKIQELEDAQRSNRVRRHDDGGKRRSTERLYSRITSPTEFGYSYRAKSVQFQQKHENHKSQRAVFGVF